jgi:hypothetical protein
MKAPRAIDKLSPDVARRCKEEGMNISIADVMFIMHRFIYYIKHAVVNGYFITLKYNNRYFKIQLCRQLFGKLTKQEKEKYFISPRLLTYMFYVNIKFGSKNIYEANFTANDEFKEMINQSLATDLAYKFIGR